MIFNPWFEKLNYIGAKSEKELNNEQQYLQSSLLFYDACKSPITHELIKIITNTDRYKQIRYVHPNLQPIIDTRVNNVVPGIWPSVPGWHLDDCYRKDKDSQPDIINIVRQPTFHWMCLVGNRDKVSNAEFLTNKYPKILINPASPYKSGNRYIEENRDRFTFARCPGNTIVFFNNQAWHRAMPATQHGIRLFFRLSLCYRKPLDIIRTTVTNYADIEKAGW